MTEQQAAYTLASAIRHANDALDWIEARHGPLPADGFATIETTVSVVRALGRETTVAGSERHEPLVMERFTLKPGGGREDYREETVCVTCWLSCDDENCIEPHARAPWPCENARLRERVAALEGALEAMTLSSDRLLVERDQYMDRLGRLLPTLTPEQIEAAALAGQPADGGASVIDEALFHVDGGA